MSCERAPRSCARQIARSLLPLALTLGSGRRVAAQEFSKQVLFVPDFVGRDRKLAKKAADIVRSRTWKGSNHREMEVVDNDDVETVIEKLAFDVDSAPAEYLVKMVAPKFRADEIVYGSAERTPDGNVRLTARLVLWRDKHLAQPLPPAVAPTVDAAGAQLAASLVAARKQLAPLRRCENSVRETRYDRAAAAAREGIAQYPRSTLARSCLLAIYAETGASADSVLAIAREVVEIDPINFRGLEAAALAYDARKERAKAGEMWVRLAESDTADLKLTERAVTALMVVANDEAARPLITRASDAHAYDASLLRLRGRVEFATKRWKAAIASHERLLALDSTAASDSSFFFRLATAYRADAQPVRAIAVAARGVSAFPGDARLFLGYTQLVQEEHEAVLARGLAAFPKSAELHALDAQRLKKSGNAREALAAAARALELDPTMPHGWLQLAGSFADVGEIDSAYTSLHRALDAREDTAVVAQFALARGNALYKTANGSKSRDDYQRALHFLSLADSLHSTPQSRFLRGATALSVAQSAATDAAKLKSCELSRLASDLLPVARGGLTDGAEVSPDAARQYVEYVGQLEPAVTGQLKALCKN